MATYTVTATIRFEFDDTEHTWVRSVEDARAEMEEYIDSGDAFSDQFDIDVEVNGEPSEGDEFDFGNTDH